MLALDERLVRYLRQTCAGRVHDQRLCDEEGSTFPPGCGLLHETGCPGCEPADVLP
jgi:hypothetical protein